jgi:hypothetical protein
MPPIALIGFAISKIAEVRAKTSANQHQSITHIFLLILLSAADTQLSP